MARIYTTGSGLPNSQVNNISQDSEGFVWICTENGLARFDGMDFTTYRNSKEDPHSIASDLVVTSYEDRRGTFWVGTATGLQIYDPELDSFTRVDLGDAQSPNSTQYISSIIEVESSGEIWVGSSQFGIYVIDSSTHEIKADRRKAILKNLSSRFVYRMFLDADGNVWVAYETGGLSVIGSKSCDGIPQNIWSRTDSAISGDVLATSFVQDGTSGDIVIGTFEHGILIYDAADGLIRRSSDAPARACKVMALMRNRISQRAGERTFLVGIENGGLGVYDLESDMLRDLDVDNIPPGTSSWKVHSLLEDSQGNTWVGAFQSGVMVIPKSMYGFDYQAFSRNLAPGGNSACVTSVLRDPRTGTLWVGTDGSGLFRTDADGTRKCYVSETTPGLSNNSIMALAQDKRGTLWIASYLGGLLTYSPGTGFRPFAFQERLGTAKTVSLAYDERNDVLYVGTYGGGLSIIDAAEGTVTGTISEDINKWVSALYIDHSGMLWVGTYNGPLCYSNASGRLIDYNIGDEGGKARVYAFCEGSDGTMWIGTGEGLISFNRIDGKTYTYTEADGLSSNVIDGLLEADGGDIWISTSYGLTRFNPGNGRFSRYYAYDGLQENEFRYGAAYKDADGRLYFGGMGGLTAFYSQIVDQKRHDVPNVYFTRLTVKNEPVSFDAAAETNRLDRNITEASNITLPYRENTFTLGFAVPEYTNPQKIVYSYKLDKSDPNWHTVSSTTRSATYNNLPSGRYNLTVKAYFDGSEEQSSSRSISIRILPPWYLSTGAFIFYIILILTLAHLIYWTVQRSRQHKKDKAESEIKELKLKMFTNISHEIRTPLTLVMSPLKKMREAETDPKQKELYNLMYRNSLRILRLVNQLMDMRKIDDGQMQFHFLRTDVVYFIRDIMQSFDNLAVSRQINFTLGAERSVTDLWIDQGNFDKIIFNILSNAFKHTPDGGEISILISAPSRNKGILPASISEYVRIDITNSGSHIDEKYLDKIFERFFQANVLDAKVGSGVGLSLAKMLVELHHGSISVANTEGGVCFSIFMPVGCEHLTPEEMSATTHHKDLYTKYLNAGHLEQGTEDVTDTPADGGQDHALKSRKTVVIVDDDSEIQRYLRMELKELYNVETFGSGRDAWAFISTSVPDLVVTDLIMEGMDGAELCEKIRHNPGTNHIPVIILTSESDEASIQRCTDSGADRFFSKPISIELLLSSIANAISTRENIRHKYSTEINYDYNEVRMNGGADQLVNRVIEVIKRNIDNPDFSVEDLSREIGMSRVHMNRKLKEAINISPSNLIKSTRLKQAAYLLINNKVNISEVAYRVGFSTHSYFSSSFREYYGMTPKEFVAKYINCKDEEVLKKIFE